MNHNTDNAKNKSTKKRVRLSASLLALTFGLCVAALTVRAEAEQTRVEIPISPAAWKGLSSRGSLIYRETEKGAEIYAADFLLLKNRLDTISDKVFDPVCYTHTHQWKFLDINGRTHTRHCTFCGHSFDLVDAHRADRHESCSLFHDDTEYPGIRYTCVCGYQWEREESHTLSFEAIDETGHRSGCCLSGTGFCPGYEPTTEEHYAYYYNSCKDGIHHEKICMDCGYQSKEECSFTFSDANDVENDNKAEAGRRCWCGNMEIGEANTGAETAANCPDAEITDDLSNTETEDENKNTQTGEKPSDMETGTETPNLEVEEDNSNTETTEENTDGEQGGKYEE